MATNISPALRPQVSSTGTNTTVANKPLPTTPAPEAPPAATEPRQPDSFSPGTNNQSAPATGAAPATLTSKLDQVLDALGLANHLGYDLTSQSAALFGQALTRDQKATRLMEFLVPYAQRFAELKQGGLSPEKANEAVLKMLQPMFAAGLTHIIETTTHRTGQDVAKSLLSASSPDEVSASMEGLRFDSTDPNGLVAQSPVQVSPNQLVKEARVSERPPEALDDETKRQSRHRAALNPSSWGAWGRFRNDVGRLFDTEKWDRRDRMLVAMGLGVLAVAMLIAGLLSLL